ncbi:MAG: CapA family protein, partial [Dehalococcoidia bacterium]
AAGVAVAAGASVVVGNHPHWVQATEWIGDAFVAYGLGNFVFDQDGFEERTQGAVLEAGFTRERLLGVRLRPTAIRERHRPEFVVPHSGESRAILGRIWDATDTLPPRESLPEAKD